MFALFVFTAVFGWLFIAIFVLSGTDFDADVGLDADLDLDADIDLDADTGASGLGDTAINLLGAFFSFRSIVFLAGFFGLTGILLTWLGANAAIAAIVGLGVGVFAAFINVKLMDYLKRTSVSSQLRDSKIEGNRAKVVLPIGPGRRGKVAIDVNGQRLYLVALPYNERHGAEYEVGDQVVVVEVHNGSALVAEMDELD